MKQKTAGKVTNHSFAPNPVCASSRSVCASSRSVGASSRASVLAFAFALACLFAILAPGGAVATGEFSDRGQEKGVPSHTISYSASKDNTLCESATGALSNALGQYLFAGNTLESKGAQRRRGLVAFDVVPSLPSDAVITDVRLNLNMDMSIAGAVDVGAHRVTTDWGEGTSDAATVDAEEGKCAPSTAGDATWTDAIDPGTTWTMAGGDFEAVASATTSVVGDAAYVWSGAGMVSDVQGWVDGTNSNFGWLIQASEATSPTAKRFASRHHAMTAIRPQLTVIFESATFEVFSDGFEGGNTTTWSSAVGLPE